MSEAPQSPVDDVFSVATLLKYMGNDDKALAIVIKIVRDACAPGMAPIEQARAQIADGRYGEAGKIFHGLRGSVGSLGARRLVTASLALEQAMTAGHAEQLPPLLAAAATEYQDVLTHAQAWLQAHAPAAGPGSDPEAAP